MATLVLPARPGVPHQRFFAELESVTYGFELRWNGRAESWKLDILDRDGNVLLAGKRVVIGFPLTIRAAYDRRLPPGQIIAIDTTGADAEPGLDDLGERVRLLYIEAGA